MANTEHETFELDGREVRLSNPSKVYFPQAGVTKGDLAHFYVECAEAVLNHLRERPTVLKRYAAVFVDYNQNAKDHTVASAYSVRPVADTRVSCPLEWDEVAGCDPADYRIDTVPARLREQGDPSADIDAHPGSLDALLDLAQRDEEDRGLSDAPWPPHFAKQAGEPKRVQPSRDRDRRRAV